MPERKYVIDTSLFVNPKAREKFGKNPTEALKNFIERVQESEIILYMPPSIFRELSNFVEPQIMEEFEVIVHKRAPNTYGIYLPAAVFYNFIENIRSRMNKGMRLAEEFAQDNKPNNDEKLRKLREKYRDAMRSGIIDSTEDFELVILAKELEAVIVSSDEGAIKFADEIGCSWVRADKFHAIIQKKSSKKLRSK